MVASDGDLDRCALSQLTLGMFLLHQLLCGCYNVQMNLKYSMRLTCSLSACTHVRVDTLSNLLRSSDSGEQINGRTGRPTPHRTELRAVCTRTALTASGTRCATENPRKSKKQDGQSVPSCFSFHPTFAGSHKARPHDKERPHLL